MKKAVFLFGGYSAIFEVVCFALTWLVIYLFNPAFGVQGYIGYASTISPLIFIYFGIRYYRDQINNGSISFLKALWVGLLIVLLPAVGFALAETVYVLVIDPEFYKNVYAHDMERYKKMLPPAELAMKQKEVQQELILDKNPFYNFSMMVLTIYSLGIIVTLISSLMLMRRNNKDLQGSTSV